MAAGSKKHDERVRRDRAQSYQVRQQVHAAQAQRRRRDNLVAGIGGGLLIAALLAGQAVYFTVGPGAPAPEPTSTPSETPAPSESTTPTPAATDAPTPTP